MYLEPIYGRENLLTDGMIFKQINNDFRYIMREVANDTRILSLTKIHGIFKLIETLDSQLDRCQNTLTSFIEVRIYE